MEHKADYDYENNIMNFSYVGKLNNEDDIDFILRKNHEALSKIGKKTWILIDISNQSVANPKLLKRFSERSNQRVDGYAHGGFVFSNKPLQKAMALLYNITSGRRVPFFKTKEEAYEHIKNIQKETGLD